MSKENVRANKEEDVLAQDANTQQPDAQAQKQSQQHVKQFATDCRKGLVSAKAILKQLLSPGVSPESFLKLYNKIGVNLEASSATAGLMQNVHPEESIREAARECEQEVSKFYSELSRNKDVYKGFFDIDTIKLDADTTRLVKHTLRDFRRAGVDRDDKTRDSLKKIDEELTRLGQEFSKNITDDVRHITVTKAQLDGLPDDFIKAHPADESGTIKITTNYPDLIPYMTYAASTEKRKELYVAARSRGGGKKRKNTPSDSHLAPQKGQFAWLSHLGRLHHRRQDDQVGEECERLY